VRGSTRHAGPGAPTARRDTRGGPREDADHPGCRSRESKAVNATSSRPSSACSFATEPTVSETTYAPTFFARELDRARTSAETIVPLVIERVEPRSVIDLG